MSDTAPYKPTFRAESKKFSSIPPTFFIKLGGIDDFLLDSARIRVINWAKKRATFLESLSFF